jgi:hypothetical protein
MSEGQKLVYIFTAAGDRAEDAVTGFILATVGLSMGHEVTAILLGYATLLAKKGYAETVAAPERQPIETLLTDVFASGGGQRNLVLTGSGRGCRWEPRGLSGRPSRGPDHPAARQF